jgi:SSS family solute:Na+ symporter
MNYLSIDAFMVYGFLLLTLVVGLWSSRNIKTIRDYAIANQTYGVGILTMTILATYLTGSKSIGLVGRAFEDGILPVVPRILCGVIITFYAIARYIAPKIIYFDGCLTLAEVMGRLYGQKVRFYIGILGVIYSISVVTLQIIWISYIGEIIHIPTQWGILLGGSFLIIYSARGGMKSIAMTDAIKFVAIVAFIPIVVSLLFHRVGGVVMLFQKLPSIHLDIIHNPHAKDYIIHCIWFLFPAFPLSFPFIQRMLMAKNKKHLVQSYYWNMGILTLVFALLICIGLASIVLREMGDINMPQQGSKVFMYLVKNYFPISIRGLICVGLLAAVMATADSFLNAAGLLLAHDVMVPILKKKQEQVNGLKISRYSTFLLGLVAMCIALIQPVLPHLQYGSIVLGKGIHMGTDLVAVVFTIPMIAGIMGLKTDANSFFISMGATLVAFIVGKLLLTDLWFMPTVISVNALSFFAAHYIQNKGFVTVKHTAKVLD